MRTFFPTRFPWRAKRPRTGWTSIWCPNVTSCTVYLSIFVLYDDPLAYERFLNLLAYLCLRINCEKNYEKENFFYLFFFSNRNWSTLKSNPLKQQSKYRSETKKCLEKKNSKIHHFILTHFLNNDLCECNAFQCKLAIYERTWSRMALTPWSRRANEQARGIEKANVVQTD
jgi:hypothetical protein